MITRQGQRLIVNVPMLMLDAGRLLQAGLAEMDGSDLTVDLSGVEEADSSALAVLLEWLRANNAKGGSLSVEGASKDLRTLASLHGLNTVMAFS